MSQAHSMIKSDEQEIREAVQKEHRTRRAWVCTLNEQLKKHKERDSNMQDQTDKKDKRKEFQQTV
jgi:hypothetical protein